jgi:HK97 family phage major capsid protein
MNLTKARELREERARKIAEARAIYDKSGRTADDDKKFDSIMAEADGLKVQIDREERLEAAETESRGSGRPPAGQVDPENPDVIKHVDEYRRMERRHGLQVYTQLRPEVRSTIEQLNGDYWQAMKLFLAFGPTGLSDEARSILSGKRAEFRGLGVGSLYDIKEYRDMGTGGGNALQGSGGGYFVPVGFVDEIEEALKFYGNMLKVAEIMTTATGQPLPYPTDNDTTVMGALVGEGQQVSESDVNIGNVVYGAYKYSSQMIKVSIELLQDSAFDLEGYVKKKMAIRIGRILNNHFTLGTGTNQPQGIMLGATQASVNGTPYLAVGASSNDGGTETGGTSIGSDDLIEIEHSVDPLYRPGAKYMGHDQTIKTLKKLKDKYGRPLWLPGIAVKAPDTLNGYEYELNNDMATIAVNAKTLLFGQLSKYIVRQVKELAIVRLNERYADYGQVAFIGFARYDGRLIDAGTHPVTYLQQAAS